MKNLFRSLLTALAFMGLSSCGTSTRVVSAWESPDASVSVMDKVLVMAMMNDRQAKDDIERAMVADLNRQGIAAVTGTAEFGPHGFGGLEQHELDNKLRRDGFTSLMLVALTDKEQQVDYVPGTPYVAPYGPTYYGYYGRYRWMYDNVYSPGYFTSTTTYVLDVDLYSLSGDQLVYSAQTQTYDPADSRRLAAGFTEEIIGDLRSRGLL